LSDKRLFEVDPRTGISTFFHYNSDDDTFVLEKQQDAEPLLDFNKARFNDAPTRWGDGQLVASIPLHLFFELKQKGIIDDQNELKKWLNDPDNRFFRTRPGDV
jgi:hypothetical protein